MVYFLKTDLIAGLITIVSLILCGVGTFIKQWWEDRTGSRSGLFTHVACAKGICQFASETDAWITVAQVTAFVQFFSLIIALLFHLLNICEVANRGLMRFLTIVMLGLACLFANIHTFLVASVYGNLGRVYDEQRPLSVTYAYFLTLPVGLNAISGTLSFGPLIALIVVHTREKKANEHGGKGAKQSKQRVPPGVQATSL